MTTSILSSNSSMVFLEEAIKQVFKKNKHHPNFVDLNKTTWSNFLKIEAPEGDTLETSIGYNNKKAILGLLETVINQKEATAFSQFVEVCFSPEADHFKADNLLQLLSTYDHQSVIDQYNTMYSTISSYFKDKQYIDECLVGYGVLQVLLHDVDFENATYNTAIAIYNNNNPDKKRNLYYVEEYENPKHVFLSLLNGFKYELEDLNRYEVSPNKLFWLTGTYFVLFGGYMLTQWSEIAANIGLS